jgi:hypothetical protein
MLLLFSYLREDNVKVLQTKDGKYILPILKNGSSSLENLVEKYPNDYKFIPLDDSVKELTVFIRDPIERFCSALAMQSRLHSIEISTLTDLVLHNKIPVIDDHIIPQFYFLLRILRDVKFSFKDITELNQIKNIEHLNKTKNNIDVDSLPLDRINYLLTEDIVLYNKFLGKTAKISDIMDEIKKESNYITDLKYFERVVKLYME